MDGSGTPEPFENVTQRGFGVYGEVVDTRGSVVRVQQSSAACVDAIWIFCHNDVVPNYKEPSPHLNKAQVGALIALLQKAHANMEDDVDIEEDEDWDIE